MKKYNNESIYFKDWTTKKLKEEARSYDSLINGEHACYGMSDLRMYSGICDELENRGVSITSEIAFN